MDTDTTEIQFYIDSITCPGCAMDMENILLTMTGVKDASVNYANGVFTIRYDPGSIAAETIIQKVKSLGFKTKILAGQH